MKVYLAGPEVFLADAVGAGALKKEICTRHGLVGLYPFDQQLDGLAPEKIAGAIFSANIAMMREADAMIANLSPFRGPSADVGTALEVGFALGLGKLLFGYSNNPASLFDRTADASPRSGLKALPDGRTLHPDGMAIEDFGLADNLMIEEAIRASGGAFFSPGGKARDLADPDLFEICVRALASRFDAKRRAATA